jgi:hypothetical protein
MLMEKNFSSILPSSPVTLLTFVSTRHSYAFSYASVHLLDQMCRPILRVNGFLRPLVKLEPADGSDVGLCDVFAVFETALFRTTEVVVPLSDLETVHVFEAYSVPFFEVLHDRHQNDGHFSYLGGEKDKKNKIMDKKERKKEGNKR